MSWWHDLKGHVSEFAPLGPLTWYGLGGPARVLYSPDSCEALAEGMRRSLATDHAFKILGGGANVLIRDDGFDGVVVRLDHPSFRFLKIEGERVVVGAGHDLMALCNTLVEHGLSGLECLAGIPGTVGGAVRMNAGGKYGSFADVVKSAEVLTPDGRQEWWSRERIGFGYRKSGIGSNVVLRAELQLKHENRETVRQRFKEYWEFKKNSQPMADRTAGCVFKNPVDASAGKLIEEAGLKGERIGGAAVSFRHANFISADPRAKADDVLQLIDRVRNRVKQCSGTELELEIDVW